MTMKQGTIIGGIVAVPDIDTALEDYRERLGFELVEDGWVGEELAGSWGCPGNAKSRMVTLRPSSGAHCFYRLVEQPIPESFVPTTTYGWGSYEITCLDVFGWPDRIAGGGFDIVGEPKEIPGMPYFVAMQVHGTGKEMLYFNEVRSNTPTSDLPKAGSQMDHIFIVILATPDRESTVEWYRTKLGLDEGETYVIAYSMINNAFGLPPETQSSITMVQKDRMPIVEVDDFPDQAKPRPRADGQLPPGNSLVSLAVKDLDACDLKWIEAPALRDGAIYAGKRSATTLGPAGELLELVEIA
ncbi:VOC family protein [Altererythrobacter sp. MF3-039]|uniref:VOC family protein n=1 Tax=Altererythrobacter sp. MF3-039 TaxID=3252901 RepID=UPI00390C7E01